MSEFFAMDGYGGFIWASYGLTGAVMAGLVVATIRDHARQRDRLRRLEAGGDPRP